MVNQTIRSLSWHLLWFPWSRGYRRNEAGAGGLPSDRQSKPELTGCRVREWVKDLVLAQ